MQNNLRACYRVLLPSNSNETITTEMENKKRNLYLVAHGRRKSYFAVKRGDYLVDTGVTLNYDFLRRDQRLRACARNDNSRGTYDKSGIRGEARRKDVSNLQTNLYVS